MLISTATSISIFNQNRMINLLVILFLSLTLFSAPAIFGQKDTFAKESLVKAEKEDFLERFIGSWSGEGSSDGVKVRDEMKLEWAFGKRFLKLSYRALEGDKYEGEEYIRFDKDQNQYEYYEFNNGRWAVRRGTGRVVNNSFVITEKRKDVEIELTFEFINPNEIKMTEGYLQKEGKKPFAVLTFRRRAASRP